MTKLTNRQTDKTARGRSDGFVWELLYLVTVATVFNAAALGAIAIASGRAGPVQAIVGVSALAMFAVAFPAVVKGLHRLGERRVDLTTPTRSSTARTSSAPPVG
jgi:hypothetical protein